MTQTDEIIERERRFLLPTYSRYPVALHRCPHALRPQAPSGHYEEGLRFRNASGRKCHQRTSAISL